MSTPPTTAPNQSATQQEPAAYLDMPPDRRAAAKAHAAMLGATMRRIAAEVPFNADVDDFRRGLVGDAKSHEVKS